jgi:hypothetical protein
LTSDGAWGKLTALSTSAEFHQKWVFPGEQMREKDRVLRRRRQRRNKRLKIRNQEEIAAKVERPVGSRRTAKKGTAEAAPPAQGGEGAPTEAPAPEKKKPAAKKAAAKAPEVAQESVPQSGEGEGA